MPVHLLPCTPLGGTGFRLSATFKERAIQPVNDVVFTDRRQDGPIRQWLLSLILEQDLTVPGLRTGEATLVYEVMMVPA